MVSVQVPVPSTVMPLVPPVIVPSNSPLAAVSVRVWPFRLMFEVAEADVTSFTVWASEPSFRAPEFAITTPLESASVLPSVASMVSTPPLMVVAPVKVLSPERVCVPVVRVRLPPVPPPRPPFWMTPEKFWPAGVDRVRFFAPRSTVPEPDSDLTEAPPVDCETSNVPLTTASELATAPEPERARIVPTSTVVEPV